MHFFMEITSQHLLPSILGAFTYLNPKAGLAGKYINNKTQQ